MGKCKANILCLNAREECRLMLTIPEVFIFWVLKRNSWSPEVVQHFQKVDCWQGQTISSVCIGLVHKLSKSNTAAWVEHIHRFVLELLLNLRLFPSMLSEYSLRFILLSPSHKICQFCDNHVLHIILYTPFHSETLNIDKERKLDIRTFLV